MKEKSSICGQPGSVRVTVEASCSSVSEAITSRTIAWRSLRRASTSSSEGCASRSQGMPSQPGASSHGRSSGCHGEALPRIIRLTHAEVAKPRWRRVWMNDHSPPTWRCSSASGNVFARATVSAHSRSSTAHASRNPSASSGLIFARSGIRRLSSASTYADDLDAVEDDVLQLAVDVDVVQLDPAHPHVVEVHHAELGAAEDDVVEPGVVEVDVGEGRAAQVRRLEARAGQLLLAKLGHDEPR